MLLKRGARFGIRYLTPHFQPHEYYCHPTCDCEWQKIDLQFAYMIETLREGTGRKTGFTHEGRAFRCPKYNAKVGGSKTSQHLIGAGGDVWMEGLDGLGVARAALQVGFRAIGVGENWAHLDSRDAHTNKLRVWTYAPVGLNYVREVLEKDLEEINNGIVTRFTS